MSLRFFNTLSKTKEVFSPLAAPQVTLYTCGPTVYGTPHIGNYASFLMADLVRRWLEERGFEVKHIKNITDVGHLVGDATADASGQDKVEHEAREQKGDALTQADVLAIARTYEEQYLRDEHELNMLDPAQRPRATETIPEMIVLIEQLVKAGCAYDAEDGVYFSVERFDRYGTLSGNTLANLAKLVEGDRVSLRTCKRHPADFALWKKRVGEHAGHLLFWESPWGDGFPGWHIECSAMSMKFLGEQIDIHTGGEDNIFPHHECEIAQSECATGKPFVRFWLHKRRVNFANTKMSKSLGNVLTLADIKAKGCSPLDLRYLFLSSHYRSHTQFGWKALDDARKARLKIVEWIGERGQECVSTEYTERFAQAMDDDLNTPEALAAVFACMSWSRKEGADPRMFKQKIEQTFGCFASQECVIPEAVAQLIAQREEARSARDFTHADQLRAQIEAQGFVLEDLPHGPRVKPA